MPKKNEAFLTSFKSKKSLGQNFLICRNIILKIVNSLAICKNSGVLEIGPGFGSLTKVLAHSAQKVVAVEIDKRLCREAKNDNVEVICGDMVTLSSILIPKVSVLTLYLSTRANEILEDTILKYGKKGLRISSHDFTFEKLRPTKEIKVKAMGLLGWTEHMIYCYEL